MGEGKMQIIPNAESLTREETLTFDERPRSNLRPVTAAFAWRVLLEDSNSRITDFRLNYH